MNKTALLKGFRWIFIFIVGFVIVIYSYKRILLHTGIESSIHTVSPGSTIVGIIQTHSTADNKKFYKALYRTTEGKCFNATFERKSYTFIENRESPCH
ncbi:hypothetical protein JI667_12885 [Bacillus sp. NTK074B]|uniref:hypothetical protein n=1 Tax=Bacillus sp. NTK074B TaxID=2802174 RepID=UPI001A8FC881|nr:hypothetical protein [Bacillus sp. NTK074B]